MTAPERIWIDNERYEQRWHIGKPPTSDRYAHVHGEYVHERLYTAQQETIAALVEVLTKLERICVNRQPDKVADGVQICRAALARAKEQA